MGYKVGVALNHGEALVERVIESVQARPGRLVLDYNKWAGPWVEGEPAPVTGVDVFPSGRPVPASLRRWLAYDGSLLRRHGWLDDDDRLTPRPLAQIAREEFGELGGMYDVAALAERFAECFLLPGGSDSRRVLATGTPDAEGEYAVFALDVDDLPCIELMYPGFDVYLADTAEVLGVERGPGYSSLAADRVYGPRMREHARHVFGGGYSEDIAQW
ncbi:hypothetical protein GCM10022255_038050 [Dactylosporangium darangshiense]|uniref:SMI1/KNR4 family protein n=2 Tax=Dactylosporangium darangshiense TaxID=579108 RepID=A0ABP8D933_9ACTN